MKPPFETTEILPLVKSTSAVAFVFLALTTSAAWAETTAVERILALDSDLVDGEKRYQLCAACHGEEGYGGLGGEFPSIAGQHPRVLLKQLFDIQSKKRINPTMYPFSDAETLGGAQGMADVIAYVSSLPVNPQPITGPADMVTAGGELYQDSCAVCHGADGDGDDSFFYPLLKGQHYPYLVREITWIRDGFRNNANPAMVEVLSDFTDGEVAAVASYISNLKP